MENLLIYTSANCHWCHKTKAFLNQKGVVYREIDVATEPLATQKLIDLTGQRSVPVIMKGNDYVVGFNPTQIEEMLQ